MSAGHLYHYFPSKDAIIDAIVEANLQRAADRFGKAVDEGVSILEILNMQLDDASHNSGHRGPLLFDMFAEAGRNPAAARSLGEHSRRMTALLIDLLRDGQNKGELDPSLDPIKVAPVLVSLFDCAKTLTLRYPDQPPSDFSGTLQLLISRLLLQPRLK